ncbi:MAG: adenosylcobinamide-GDP ribazoletransferase [Solirubrobacterales bacterium]
MLESLLAAFRFLTILPLPGWTEGDEDMMQAAAGWFPLVGIVVAGMAALAGWLTSFWLAPGVSAAVVLLVSWVMSGGLHSDGLMDTADGIMARRSRERTLEIMRDSRVGAMGAAAALLVYLLKWSLLADLIGSAPAAVVPGILMAAAAAGRWGMVYGLTLYPYARQQGGVAQAFQPGKGRIRLAFATAVFLLIVFGLVERGGVYAVLVSLFGAAALSALLARRLKGLTGDTYGAIEEIVETAALMALVAMY